MSVTVPLPLLLYRPRGAGRPRVQAVAGKSSSEHPAPWQSNRSTSTTHRRSHQAYATAVCPQWRVIEADASPALCVEGNQNWLDLAVGNLVSNGLRYGTGTSPCPPSSTEPIGARGQRRWRRLPEDYRDTAFDRLSHVETSRTSGGIGLGLALVKAVAEAHDGTGTVQGFQVTLDLATPVTERSVATVATP